MDYNTHGESQGLRSTIDFGRNKAEKGHSKRYIAYLHEWDRRMKKGVAGPPADFHHVNEINGVRVLRKGKGQPPKCDMEQQWQTSGKKIVPGVSHLSCENLLELSCRVTPCNEQQRPLTADESRQRFTRRVTQRHNVSSLVGAGAVVNEHVSVTFKQRRGTGAANPGRVLNAGMTKVVAFDEDSTKEDFFRPSQSFVWCVAPRPNTADNIIRHRMSDPNTEAKPAKLDALRTINPAIKTVIPEESRSTFYSSLNDYARNKVRGQYGVQRRGTTSALAGL
eukprot:GHRR01004677.1.p1 GENE.GHRR01004677.1~~GHRR01004677.1.p1  ORF type:complete len:279 (+),score=63.20 GHRR01004677.1:274-1110(+)